MRLLAVCDLSHQTCGTGSGMEAGAYGLLRDLPVSLRILGLLQVCCHPPLYTTHPAPASRAALAYVGGPTYA